MTTPNDHGPVNGALHGAEARSLETIDEDECMRLLRRSVIGRVIFVTGGIPTALPINIAVDGDDVIFATEPGSTLRSINENATVCVEADDFDFVYHTGWSVLLTGTLHEVGDSGAMDRDRRIPLQPWAPGARSRLMRVRAWRVTGRRIVLSPVHPHVAARA